LLRGLIAPEKKLYAASQGLKELRQIDAVVTAMGKKDAALMFRLMEWKSTLALALQADLSFGGNIISAGRNMSGTVSERDELRLSARV
jgi:hypothetical protein